MRPLPACLQIARSAGLSSAFVDPKGKGVGAITVTGWAALLSICALVAVGLGMLGFGVWKFLFSDNNRRYTQLQRADFKQGDV